MRMVFVAVVLLGCGKGASKSEVEACNHMAKLCGDELSAKDLQECAADFPKFRKEFGEETANKFVTCTREAKSCPEVLGCAAGVLGRMTKDIAKGMDKMQGDIEKDMQELEKQTKEIEKGFDNMTKDMPGGPHDDDDGPLPAECKRADDVCAKDEPFARDKCRTMVGNLKADPDNLKALTTCYAEAKNCYAFKDCTTQMFFKLN